MAQLIVRGLEESVVQALKRRAAEHGRSAEAEHREILREALAPKQPRQSIKDMLLAMPRADDDDELCERPLDYGRDVEL
jgi:antitoxin FitA